MSKPSYDRSELAKTFLTIVGVVATVFGAVFGLIAALSPPIIQYSLPTYLTYTPCPTYTPYITRTSSQGPATDLPQIAELQEEVEDLRRDLEVLSQTLASDSDLGPTAAEKQLAELDAELSTYDERVSAWKRPC